MKEIIKTKVDNIQDEALLNKINDLVNSIQEKLRLTADELFKETVEKYGDTLRRLANN